MKKLLLNKIPSKDLEPIRIKRRIFWILFKKHSSLQVLKSKSKKLGTHLALLQSASKVVDTRAQVKRQLNLKNSQIIRMSSVSKDPNKKSLNLERIPFVAAAADLTSVIRQNLKKPSSRNLDRKKKNRLIPETINELRM